MKNATFYVKDPHKERRRLPSYSKDHWKEGAESLVNKMTMASAPFICKTCQKVGVSYATSNLDVV